MNEISVQELEKLSPFELKDLLIKAAKKSADKSASMMLNAGRGNPNWIATTPREAFFLLGKFALEEARLDRDEPGVGLAGMPQADGIAGRFESFLAKHSGDPGAGLLRGVLD
ncbi:MAG: hypothetical protein WBN60_06575, partial [Polyangiales bacterium]